MAPVFRWLRLLVFIGCTLTLVRTYRPTPAQQGDCFTYGQVFYDCLSGCSKYSYLSWIETGSGEDEPMEMPPNQCGSGSNCNPYAQQPELNPLCCFDNGEECEASKDCCSHYCDTDLDRPVCCIPSGQACVDDYDCCSEDCEGTCV